jgi:hypothetical protein
MQDQERTRGGLGDRDRVSRLEPCQEGLGLGELTGADQESEPARGSDQAGGDGQDSVEAFDGAESYDIVTSSDGFGSGNLYIDVRQYNGADEFFEERGFLVVGFDQGEGYLRRPEPDGDAGESGAGADVRERKFLALLTSGLMCPIIATVCARGCALSPHRYCDFWSFSGEQVSGCEEALAEVAGYDFFRGADGGKVDARIPAPKHIDIYRYAGEGLRVEAVITEERVQQIANAGRVHGFQILNCRLSELLPAFSGAHHQDTRLSHASRS